MSMTPPDGDHPLMTATEVAAAFGVNIRAVARWRREGKIACVDAPGRCTFRYYRAEVEAFLAGTPLTPAQVEALRGQVLP